MTKKEHTQRSLKEIVDEIGYAEMPIEVKYNKISMEMNPDKQLINELQIKLSDCERWLKEKDREIIELENKVTGSEK